MFVFDNNVSLNPNILDTRLMEIPYCCEVPVRVIIRTNVLIKFSLMLIYINPFIGNVMISLLEPKLV